MKDEAESLKAQEEEARESYFKGFISHLKYSEFDWTIPIKEFKAGKCIVKGMNCQLTPNMAKNVRRHFLSKQHMVLTLTLFTTIIYHVLTLREIGLG